LNLDLVYIELDGPVVTFNFWVVRIILEWWLVELEIRN